MSIDREKILRQLAHVHNQVAESDGSVARHRQAVAELERNGQDASLARKMLDGNPGRTRYTQDKLARITTVIVQCCVSKETWVACDADGNIVGVVLAEPNRRKRDGSIRLPYIGVSKDERQRGIFGALMQKLMTKKAPLTASVLHGNQSGMADRLVKLGFTKVDSDDEETRLKWTP